MRRGRRDVRPHVDDDGPERPDGVSAIDRGDGEADGPIAPRQLQGVRRDVVHAVAPDQLRIVRDRRRIYSRLEREPLRHLQRGRRGDACAVGSTAERKRVAEPPLRRPPACTGERRRVAVRR